MLITTLHSGNNHYQYMYGSVLVVAELLGKADVTSQWDYSSNLTRTRRDGTTPTATRLQHRTPDPHAREVCLHAYIVCYISVIRQYRGNWLYPFYCSLPYPNARLASDNLCWLKKKNQKNQWFDLVGIEYYHLGGGRSTLVVTLSMLWSHIRSLQYANVNATESRCKCHRV